MLILIQWCGIAESHLAKTLMNKCDFFSYATFNTQYTNVEKESICGNVAYYARVPDSRVTF